METRPLQELAIPRLQNFPPVSPFSTMNRRGCGFLPFFRSRHPQMPSISVLGVQSDGGSDMTFSRIRGRFPSSPSITSRLAAFPETGFGRTLSKPALLPPRLTAISLEPVRSIGSILRGTTEDGGAAGTRAIGFADWPNCGSLHRTSPRPTIATPLVGKVWPNVPPVGRRL